MKKVLIPLFLVLMLVIMSVTAFAEVSPTAPVFTNVTVKVPYSFAGTVDKVAVGDNLSFAVNPNDGYEFGSWTITGTLGVDYEIVSGSLNSADLVIKPIGDVVVTANFLTDEGKPITETTQGGTNGSDKSPVTGSDNVVYISFALVAAFAVVLASRKKLIKE